MDGKEKITFSGLAKWLLCVGLCVGKPFCQTRVSCRFIGGFQDTRTNKEDFALTPYLFGVWVTCEVIKVRGIGICWGYYSVYLGLGWNIPKNYPSFKVLSKNGGIRKTKLST